MKATNSKLMAAKIAVAGAVGGGVLLAVSIAAMPVFIPALVATAGLAGSVVATVSGAAALGATTTAVGTQVAVHSAPAIIGFWGITGARAAGETAHKRLKGISDFTLMDLVEQG